MCWYDCCFPIWLLFGSYLAPFGPIWPHLAPFGIIENSLAIITPEVYTSIHGMHAVTNPINGVCTCNSNTTIWIRFSWTPSTVNRTQGPYWYPAAVILNE